MILKLDDTDIELLRAMKEMELEGSQWVSSYFLSKFLYDEKKEDTATNFHLIRNKCRVLTHRMDKLVFLGLLKSELMKLAKREGKYYKIIETDKICNGGPYPQLKFIDQLTIVVENEQILELESENSLIIIEDKAKIKLYNLNLPYKHLGKNSL